MNRIVLATPIILAAIAVNACNQLPNVDDLPDTGASPTGPSAVSYTMTARMDPGDIKVSGSALVSAASILTVPTSLIAAQGTAESSGSALLWLEGTPGSGAYCQYRMSVGGTYDLKLSTSVGCDTTVTVNAGTTLVFEFQTGYFSYPETPPLSVILPITLDGATI